MIPSFNRLIQRLRGGSDFMPSVPQDFTQSPSQRPRRSLKANSQAAMVARMLQQGSEFTVQDVVKVLASKKLVSNEPGRRVREAVA